MNGGKKAFRTDEGRTDFEMERRRRRYARVEWVVCLLLLLSPGSIFHLIKMAGQKQRGRGRNVSLSGKGDEGDWGGSKA